MNDWTVIYSGDPTHVIVRGVGMTHIIKSTIAWGRSLRCVGSTVSLRVSSSREAE